MVNYCMLLGLFFVITIDASPKQNDYWKIVGGQEATEEEYPWIVSIRKGNYHSCGGCIVDKEWVVTAAHCISSPPPTSIKVGSNSISEGGDIYYINARYKHEQFDSQTLQNDIAIINVEPITFGDGVKSIVVESEDFAGQVPVTLSAWGMTNLSSSNADRLQEINLTTITLEECQTNYTQSIVESQICTFAKVGEGTCFGDSGSPLVRWVDNEAKFAGIVSWGKPCAIGYPDVFTRVSSFIGWLNSKCDGCIKV